MQEVSLDANSLSCLVLFHDTCSPSDRPSCSLYLAPSLLGRSAGRGIFAGEPIADGDTVVIEQSLTVKHKTIGSTQLNNYVYNAGEDGYSMVLLGAACIFNHHSSKQHLTHFWVDIVVAPIDAQLSEPFANHTKVLYSAERDVKLGQEILVTYGRDSWFHDRRIPYDSWLSDKMVNEVYDIDVLKKVGHCLSDLYMDESVIPMAGKGIFSKLAYKKGDIVAITPVLSLPKHVINSLERTCVLMNYCIAEEDSDSDMVLLPLTLASMFNHGGSVSNVAMEWYTWADAATLRATLNMSGDALVDSPFAQLDLAYRATRDIAEGEELLLNYGESWEREWVGHLDRLSQWLTLDELSLATKPQFRHYIEPPAGLFPSHWKSGCLGVACAEIPYKLIEAQNDIDNERLRHEINIAKSQDFIGDNFVTAINTKDEL